MKRLGLEEKKGFSTRNNHLKVEGEGPAKEPWEGKKTVQPPRSFTSMRKARWDGKKVEGGALGESAIGAYLGGRTSDSQMPISTQRHGFAEGTRAN